MLQSINSKCFRSCAPVVITTPSIIVSILKQGTIDSTEKEVWQIFSCLSVTAKNITSCLPLLEME